MAKARVKVEKFDRINKSRLKDCSRRTRTGAYKGRTRTKAHRCFHKHR